MPLSDYVSLGVSGLRVSPFCLGAMTFGEDWGWGASVEESQRILDYFIDRGGNFIDTANSYTKGHSEKIIGDHIGRHAARRQHLVIATKFFASMHSHDPNSGGAGRKSLIAACDESLRRLQTDYIDLYWMHCGDRFTPIEETMRALDDLTRAGKIRYIGFSNTPAWKVVQAHLKAQMRGWTPLIALELEYSLLERTIEGELIPAALECGLGITAWSPLRYGMLTGKYGRESLATEKPTRGIYVTRTFSEEAFRVVDVVKTVAAEVSTSPACVALAWVRQKPGITSPIIGVRSVDQLEHDLGALDIKLTEQQVRLLDEVSQPKLNFPHDYIRDHVAFGYNGATINGVSSAVSLHCPRNDAERY